MNLLLAKKQTQRVSVQEAIRYSKELVPSAFLMYTPVSQQLNGADMLKLTFDCIIMGLHIKATWFQAFMLFVAHFFKFTRGQHAAELPNDQNPTTILTSDS